HPAGGRCFPTSAPAQQAPDGGHHLPGSLLPVLVLRANHARARVPVEEPERDLVEGGLDRGDLGENVYAIAVLGHHPLDTAHLTLDTAKATMQLILGGGVPARWHHFVSLAHHGNRSTNPWGVC